MANTHRRTHPAPALALVLAAAVLGACATGEAPSATPDPSPSQTARLVRSAVPVETAPPEPPRVIGDVPEAIFGAILADAEDRSGVPAADIVVLTAADS